MSKIIIQQNIPLAPFTTFKIGGPAKYFAEVSSEEELLEAVKYAQEKNLDVFVLGGGSNVVISDNGFDGLVIKINCKKERSSQAWELRSLSTSNILLNDIWSGEALPDVVNFCSKNSLTGLEWAAGIPGAFGGAVRGNAGAYGGEMKDIIVSVKIVKIPDAEIKIYENSECNFSYRSSLFKEDKNLVIISAIIRLEKGDRAEIIKKVNETIAKRNEKLPGDFSAGSFFQNPTVHNAELIARFEKDTGAPSRGNKIPAGWLIQEAGLQGKKIGGVMVSEKHANFVVNLGNGKAEEIVILVSFIKQQVRDKLGVELFEEVQYIGF